MLLTWRQMQVGTSPAQMVMATDQDDPNQVFRQIVNCTEEHYIKGGGQIKPNWFNF